MHPAPALAQGVSSGRAQPAGERAHGAANTTRKCHLPVGTTTQHQSAAVGLPPRQVPRQVYTLPARLHARRAARTRDVDGRMRQRTAAARRRPRRRRATVCHIAAPSGILRSQDTRTQHRTGASCVRRAKPDKGGGRALRQPPVAPGQLDPRDGQLADQRSLRVVRRSPCVADSRMAISRVTSTPTARHSGRGSRQHGGGSPSHTLDAAARLQRRTRSRDSPEGLVQQEEAAAAQRLSQDAGLNRRVGMAPLLWRTHAAGGLVHCTLGHAVDIVQRHPPGPRTQQRRRHRLAAQSHAPERRREKVGRRGGRAGRMGGTDGR